MKKKEQDKYRSLKKLAERLHDPLQFRIFVTVVMLAIGYAGVYMPLSERIEKTTRKLRRAKEYQHLVEEIQDLKAEVERVSARLPKNTDTNEWAQYVFGGIRKLPVKLVKMDSDDPRRVGPFYAVVLKVQLQGDYEDLEAFLKWIETNERLFRVDTIAVSPARGSNRLEMNVKLLGLRA